MLGNLINAAVDKLARLKVERDERNVRPDDAPVPRVIYADEVEW